MQPSRHQRAPGSFSPLPGSITSSAAAAAALSSSSLSTSATTGRESPRPPLSLSTRPQIRRIESSSSDETGSQISVPKLRSPQTPVQTSLSPSYPSFTAQGNTSQASLNFSRPQRPTDVQSVRTVSPLTLPSSRPVAGIGGNSNGNGYHSRKHSQTQGLFDSSMPSTSNSNLSQVGINHPGTPTGLTASQIAAQAAMQHQQHNRNRSQTVPLPAGGGESSEPAKRQASRTGPLSPPLLSLTEASMPRESGLSTSNSSYHNGLLGSHSAAATTAANVAFPRTSPQASPSLDQQQQQHFSYPTPAPPAPDKPAKAEKSKVKLFSRPKKIDTKGEAKEKPLPSPGKIGSALATLQRGNYSTSSLLDNQSLYSLNNSSSATIRAVETPVEKESKEKKINFLSRQKHKLSSKDDYNLPLSSASSNSRPSDPNAPSSLYNFNVPASPGPTTSSFAKSVSGLSGLDLRHGGRALREKRKEEKHGLGLSHDNESLFTVNTTAEWFGSTTNLSNTLAQTQSNTGLHGYTLEPGPIDGSKYGLNNMMLDDAWPFLKAKLLVIFEGEDLRLPVEDFNRIVSLHLQYCISRRSAHIIIEDLRELLATGFASLDRSLRMAPEDRLVHGLVELWVFTFTSVLPYMQAVFLPLDLEFAGNGPLLSPEQAREFWGGVLAASPAPGMYLNGPSFEPGPQISPAGQVLEVRRLVLLAYRDALILPRYEKLKLIFSRLSLEHLPSSLASMALASPPPIGDGMGPLSSSPRDNDSFGRPGTAMSLDPSVASYNSSSSTLLGSGGDQHSNPSRSRAISNVSFGSHGSDPQSAGGNSLLRPFTPSREGSGLGSLGYIREGREGSISREMSRDQNVEDSKQVTEMVGRLLQCMSVLSSIGSSGLDPTTSAPGSYNLGSNNTAASAGGTPSDEGSRMVTELGRLLKLNWLGRGRTGRNRRGIVGGRVRRPGPETTADSTGLGIGSIGSNLGALREGVGAAG